MDALIEGAVLHARGRVRITAQLISAATDTTLWAQSYERDVSDVLALQGEISRDIVSQIKLELTPAEKVRLSKLPTVVPEAHIAYLKGRHHLNRWTEEDFNKSIEYFQQAIRLDPASPLGHAGLAMSYGFLGSFSIALPSESFPVGKEEALKALAIDPAVGEARVALAWIYWLGDWNWLDAEKEFKRLSSRHRTTLLPTTTIPISSQRQSALNLPLSRCNRLNVLDPLSSIVNTCIGTLYVLRDGMISRSASSERPLSWILILPSATSGSRSHTSNRKCPVRPSRHAKGQSHSFEGPK